MTADTDYAMALARLRGWLATYEMLGLPPAQMVADLRIVVRRPTGQGGGR